MTPLLSYRRVLKDDIPIICTFPQNEDELYYMFPRATFPLTPEQLQDAIDHRFESTVVLSNNHIAAFANFIEIESQKYCVIGNVIVNPVYRGHGIGMYLINTMGTIARNVYAAEETRLSCFHTNVAGIVLYTKLGYRPYEIEKRIDKKNAIGVIIRLKKSFR